MAYNAENSDVSAGVIQICLLFFWHVSKLCYRLFIPKVLRSKRLNQWRSSSNEVRKAIRQLNGSEH